MGSYDNHPVSAELIITKNSPSKYVYLAKKGSNASFSIDTSFLDAYLLTINMPKEKIYKTKTYTISNKRMAKNAIFLYIRTAVIMIVTLYTSRVILQILGETDYGVYNVVGGITMMFTFVTSALTSATQRFLNYELGKGDVCSVKDVFCMSMNIYLIFALIVIILSETVGLWFLNTLLNIPQERMTAALWVYQFSIFTSCINLIRIPYNASIIAYEKMSFYAYMSIAEAVLKLAMVYLLLITTTDNLILYSMLLTIVSILIFFAYYYYSVHAFDTCRYKMYWNKTTSKHILSFSGWSVLGSAAVLCSNQGISFVMNIFCGVIVNAALGISHQVQVAFHSFVGGFQTAFNPQLVKSYALNDKSSFFSLLYMASRISYFLMLIPAIPMYFWCDKVLSLWLGNVPEFAVEFTKMVILYALIDSLSNPLWISVQASGKIKCYQLWISIVSLMNLPIAYILLKMGYSPIYVMIVKVGINALIHIGRMIHLKYLIGFSFSRYFKEVLNVVFLVTILSLPYAFFMHDASCYILHIIMSIVFTGIIIGFLGLNRKERNFIVDNIKNVINKK